MQAHQEDTGRGTLMGERVHAGQIKDARAGAWARATGRGRVEGAPWPGSSMAKEASRLEQSPNTEHRFLKKAT